MLLPEVKAEKTAKPLDPLREGQMAVASLGWFGPYWGFRGTEETSEARVSNTGRSNSSEGKTGSLDLRAGLDWFKTYIYGRNVSQAKLEEIAALKLSSQKGGGEHYVELGGLQWLVKPNGAGQGSNHFDFLLSRDGVTIGLADRGQSTTSKGTRAIAFIEAPGQYCMGRDAFAVLRQLHAVLESTGICATSSRPSRVDLHLDFHGLSVADVLKEFGSSKIVNRSRMLRPIINNGVVETLEVGSRNAATFLVVYDKQRELAKNPMKEELYKERFHVSEIGTCTRFEFRLSGECLREVHAVADANDFLVKLPGIARWCVSDWFRVVSRAVTNENYDVPLESWWAEAAEFFEIAFRSEGGSEPRMRKPRIPEPVKLSQQVRGLFASMFAAVGVQGKDAFALIEAALASMVQVAKVKLPAGMAEGVETLEKLLVEDRQKFVKKCSERAAYWAATKGAIVRNSVDIYLENEREAYNIAEANIDRLLPEFSG